MKRPSELRPQHTNTLLCYSKLQIWNIGSSQCEFELDDDMMMSFDYLTNGDQLQVITGHIDNPVRVRDHQERTHY